MLCLQAFKVDQIANNSSSLICLNLGLITSKNIYKRLISSYFEFIEIITLQLNCNGR